MFESDDYDQILSQFEFPEAATSNAIHDSKCTKVQINGNNGNKVHVVRCNNTNVEIISSEFEGTTENEKINTLNRQELNSPKQPDDVISLKSTKIKSNQNSNNLQMYVNEPNSHYSNQKINNAVQTKLISNKKAVEEGTPISPKHMKRKMINEYFNHNNKRKFPGPAGILSNCNENNKDESICQMELLSQDVDFSQNNLRSDLFESPLWTRLLEDLKDWNVRDIDSIKTIKQKTITGSFRRKKAHTVIAFVEAVDRSVTDPLIIMRDSTGNIKGTLHRDAWSAFSQYIASEYCAFVLWKPTILTTGAAFKKYYLNITLSNILAVYSSTVLSEELEKKPLPDGYTIVSEDDYTVIKRLNSVQNTGVINTLSIFDNESSDLPEDLDSIFSDVF